MSVVTVQLGQCGNQVGTQLFNKLFQDSTSPSSPSYYKQVALERFFHEFSKPKKEETPLQARAVLVDMESKVIHSAMTEARSGGCYMYDPGSVHSEKKGSGNNWANGYLNHGPASKEAIMNVVRRQVERCDHLDSFLVLMSVAGGTGSGVGARLTEYLTEEHPSNPVVNVAVWPYSSGEVIVQDYNSLLTMSHLQEASEAVLVLQNEQLHKVCSKSLHMKNISLMDINKIAAHMLASILQPALPFRDGLCDTSSAGGTSSLSKGPSPKTDGYGVNDSIFWSSCRLSSLVSSLCPHPFFKVLTTKAIPHILDSTKPYTNYLWPVLLKNLRQMSVTDSPTDLEMDWAVDPSRHSLSRSSHRASSYSKSLSNLLVLRGSELETADPGMFRDPRLYADLVPRSCTCSVWCSPVPFNRYEKSCSLVSNSQACVVPLDAVCGKAWHMFSSRAYVHQYERFGLIEEDFMRSFVSLEQLIRDYRNI